MPEQGGNAPLVFSQTRVPERYQEALAAGINFFELVYPTLRKDGYPNRIFGPFNVKASFELISGTNKQRANVHWLLGNDAYVEFESINRRGVAVAYMPDEKYWHNRNILADPYNQFLYNCLHNYHTRDDTIPGRVIKKEIDYLREELYEYKIIYRVLNGSGAEREFSLDKPSAEGVALAHKAHNWSVVEGRKLYLKPHIEEMVKRNRTMDFGWTECREFQERVKPRVMERIADIETTPNDSRLDMRQAVIDALSNMTADERKRLIMSAIEGNAEEKAPEPEPETGVGAEADVGADMIGADAEPEPEASPETVDAGPEPEPQRIVYKHYQLHKMTVVDVRVIAKELGLDTDDVTKKDLIEAVLSAQEKSGKEVATVR